MTPEIPSIQQNPINPPRLESSGFSMKLDAEQIQKLSQHQKAELEKIKPHISRKNYYAIEEKITEEEKSLREILDWQQGKQSKLSKYSLILNPHFFEQELMN